MGRLSQTKYYLSRLPCKITITRRHHPLEGQELELLSAGKTWVVVRLADGSSLKILRRWTGPDGGSCAERAGDFRLCLRGLRELLKLFESLRARRRMAAHDADETIDAPHNVTGQIDVQTEAAGVCRGGMVGGTLEWVSRACET